jgi:hypothetical protein
MIRTLTLLQVKSHPTVLRRRFAYGQRERKKHVMEKNDEMHTTREIIPVFTSDERIRFSRQESTIEDSNNTCGGVLNVGEALINAASHTIAFLPGQVSGFGD